MTESADTRDDAPDTPPRAPPRAARPRQRHWKLKAIIAAVILLPIAGFALWTWIALSFSYSSGERAGFVQKFSRKGWLCKTWEGDLAMVNLPGTMPQLFYFSVRDDAVAQRINDLMGQRVALTYDQHKGVPGSCFGETEYYVTSVKKAAGP